MVCTCLHDNLHDCVDDVQVQRYAKVCLQISFQCKRWILVRGLMMAMLVTDVLVVAAVWFRILQG